MPNAWSMLLKGMNDAVASSCTFFQLMLEVFCFHFIKFRDCRENFWNELSWVSSFAEMRGRVASNDKWLTNLPKIINIEHSITRSCILQDRGLSYRNSCQFPNNITPYQTKRTRASGKICLPHSEGHTYWEILTFRIFPVRVVSVCQFPTGPTFSASFLFTFLYWTNLMNFSLSW